MLFMQISIAIITITIQRYSLHFVLNRCIHTHITFSHQSFIIKLIICRVVSHEKCAYLIHICEMHSLILFMLKSCVRTYILYYIMQAIESGDQLWHFKTQYRLCLLLFYLLIIVYFILINVLNVDVKFLTKRTGLMMFRD